jgi:hypothetical protein
VGTAVLLGGLPFEVVDRQRAGSGEAWTLRPWPEDEAMRGVFPLDEAWVAGLERDRLGDRSARLRWWLLPVVPLLGFAPASLQASWELRWGFPALAATLLSALGELVLATLGIVHTLASAFGGTRMASGPLTWLGLASPLLLLPPASRPLPATRGRPPSLLRTTTATALACLAPRELQEEWGPRIGVRPVLLTVLGAGAECCGALVNLQSGAADGSSFALAVNLAVLVEGVARFVLLIGSGRPVGSLIGPVLRPLLARLLAPNP